jgi:hypothetical protein
MSRSPCWSLSQGNHAICTARFKEVQESTMRCLEVFYRGQHEPIPQRPSHHEWIF